MQKIGFDQLELNPFTVIGNDNFLLTAGGGSDWNTMTAGWGGFGYIWNDPVAFVFVRKERYTLQVLERSDLFTLSFFPPERKGVLDFCGTTSEANLIMTCRKIAESVMDESTLIDSGLKALYPQEDWHRMFIGRILGVYIN